MLFKPKGKFVVYLSRDEINELLLILESQVLSLENTRKFFDIPLSDPLSNSIDFCKSILRALDVT